MEGAEGDKIWQTVPDTSSGDRESSVIKWIFVSSLYQELSDTGN